MQSAGVALDVNLKITKTRKKIEVQLQIFLLFYSAIHLFIYYLPHQKEKFSAVCHSVHGRVTHFPLPKVLWERFYSPVQSVMVCSHPALIPLTRHHGMGPWLMPSPTWLAPFYCPRHRGKEPGPLPSTHTHTNTHIRARRKD